MIEDVPEDWVDLVQCLSDEQCDFVIVGAHALAAHGAPRATGDLDVFVRPDPANAERVFRALVRFGAPVAAHGVSARDFVEPGNVYQIGLPPNRIDILTELSGVSFDEAARDTIAGHLGAAPVRCIGLDATAFCADALASHPDPAGVASHAQWRAASAASVDVTAFADVRTESNVPSGGRLLIVRGRVDPSSLVRGYVLPAPIDD